MKFAVVDIETTGLFHQGHGITEVAVVHLDGDCAVPAFRSLVNPGRKIPGMISSLTGIENKSVDGAPSFEAIAEDLLEAIEGRIFVAHNVNFDFNFLKSAFEAVGLVFKPKRLCTMRLSRKALPNLSSHKLSAICRELSIVNEHEHRAYGDAMATAGVLQYFMLYHKSCVLEVLKQNSRHTVLPPAIETETANNLPEHPGVYYFYGEGPKPLYIGKAKNLKKRILSHFTGSGSTRRKQMFQRLVRKIDYKETLSEYAALLLEDAEIKRLNPALNKAQKEKASSYAVVSYRNRSGALRLAILPKAAGSEVLACFHSHHSAKTWLFQALIESNINPAVAGLYCSEDLLPAYDTEREEDRLKDFIAENREQNQESFILISPLRESEYLCVAIIEGKYRGFANIGEKTPDVEEIKEKLTPAPDSATARAVLRRMINDRATIKHAL